MHNRLRQPHTWLIDLQDSLEQLSPQVLCGTVFILSTLALIPIWAHYDIVARDGAHLYIPVAKLFLEGRFHEALYGTYKPIFPLPLYEFSIFLMAKTTGFDLELSGRLVSALSFVLGSLGVYKVTELIFKNRLTALLSVLFFISNGELLDRSVDCLKESLLVCLVVWGNYYILKGIYSERGTWFFFLGTSLFLLGALVRGTALIFFGAWLIIGVFYKREGLTWRLMILSVPLLGVFLIGYFMPTLPIFRRSLSFIRFLSFDHWVLTPSIFFYMSQDFFREFLARSFYGIAVFGLLGLYYLRREYYAIHIMIVMVIFYFVCMKTGWNYTGRGSDRYILAPIIWLIPIASYAVFRAITSSGKFLKYLAILAIVVCPMLFVGKAFTPPDQDRLARKAAGLWILSQVGPHQDMITTDERITFYGHGHILYLHDDLVLGTIDKKVAKRYPEGSDIVLSDIINPDRIRMPIAIEIRSSQGNLWKNYLDSLKIRPNRVFREIWVYLPGRIRTE